MNNMIGNNGDKYYDELISLYRVGELRSLQNKDRAHNADIVRVMLDTTHAINMYCGEMSIFRENFYSHIENDSKGKGVSKKRKLIESLENFIDKDNAKLNIIVENYSDQIFTDLISTSTFIKGIKKGVISIRKINKSNIMSDGLSHFVYTDRDTVRMEEDMKHHSGMYLVNMPDILRRKLENNFKIMTRASQAVCI